jgi:hypothetical protein
MCRTCHSSATWRTSKFDHTKTAFPLRGRHQSVACTACHKGPAARTSPAFATCASCHADPHRGTFKQDCVTCHAETSFRTAAAFDHDGTGFRLTERHAGLACAACHKAAVPARAAPVPRPAPGRPPARGAPRATAAAQAALDFRGLQPACASCHADPHRDQLGPSCGTCHTARTFAVTAFAHPGPQDLFAGAHAPLACAACHQAALPPSTVRQFRGTPTACAACHQDVHLGQVGPECASCHAVTSPKFAATGFAHERARFALNGAHAAVPCVQCHPRESRAFPAGTGTAMRLTGIATSCVSCHADVHLGQVGTACERCHSSAAFAVRDYVHQDPPRGFFVGRHLNLACAKCHQTRTGRFPAGAGTALDLRVGVTCVACHVDVHRGSLGPDCAACHRPEPLRPSHVTAAAAPAGARP